LFFAASAQNDVETRQLRKLGEMLGTYWTRETVQAMFSDETTKPAGREQRLEHMVLPLLLGIQPEIQDFLRKRFGTGKGVVPTPEWYRQNPGEVVEGWDQSREEFINMASMFTRLIPKS